MHGLYWQVSLSVFHTGTSDLLLLLQIEQNGNGAVVFTLQLMKIHNGNYGSTKRITFASIPGMRHTSQGGLQLNIPLVGALCQP